MFQKYCEISGPIVIIGYGSIGKGTLPLLKRHINFDYSQLVVIDPKQNISGDFKHVPIGLTPTNFQEVLNKHIIPNSGFCINLSVDVSSMEIIKYCREKNVPYIDASIEMWKGAYSDNNVDRSLRTNYSLRELFLQEKKLHPKGPTIVTCCGANPGMVSWFVKKALMILSKDILNDQTEPVNRKEWGILMQKLKVKGIHIAERDTQYRNKPKPPDTFVNTWSVDGFISESFQPVELGWGTHEKKLPYDAHTYKEGCQSSIWLDRIGASTRVLTWCPTLGQQYGFLVTHNESISISDYFTIGDKNKPIYRPTCHYAYHPCNDSILSLHEILGTGKTQNKFHILDASEITDGIDELGVLLYGHSKNALWFGSRLSNKETKQLAPYQNATGLQVTSAILAGIVWAVENPGKGLVEADEMDYKRCLEIQTPYLGPVESHYTEWNPLSNLYDKTLGKREDWDVKVLDNEDPWQFQNIIEK